MLYCNEEIGKKKYMGVHINAEFLNHSEVDTIKTVFENYFLTADI